MLSSFLESNTVKGSLSIDRVTFLLYSPSLSLWAADNKEYRTNERRLQMLHNRISEILAPVLDPDFPQGFPSELFRYHYRTLDGVDLQMGSQMPKRKKIDDRDYVQAFGTDEDKENGFMYDYHPNDYAFRVEYNPNKTNLESVKKLLGGICYGRYANTIRVARLDIAIDFPATIIPEMVLCAGMRKGNFHYGTKGVETVYFGSKQSSNQFRLYNKRQELIDKEQLDIGYDLWRLELESRLAFQLLAELPDYGKIFGRFSFCDGGLVSGDWKLDLIKAQAMQWGLTTVLRKLPKQTAIRYRKLFAESQTVKLETPSFVFAQSFPAAFMKVKCDILTSCGFNLVTPEQMGYLRQLEFEL